MCEARIACIFDTSGEESQRANLTASALFLENADTASCQPPMQVALLPPGSCGSVVTPIFEAPDENYHFAFIQRLSQSWELPVQNAAVKTPWYQEGSQPPLYYMLAAIITAWIDTSDLDKVRRLNPHADIGILVPDGNVNMIAHDNRRPSGRKYFGLLRSDTDPMRNLDVP